MFSSQYGSIHQHLVCRFLIRKETMLTAGLAVALQLYYCSRILLLLHRPLLGGLEMHVEMRKCLTQYAGIVCGIAMTLSDSSSAVMCSQSLFIGKYPLTFFSSTFAYGMDSWIVARGQKTTQKCPKTARKLSPKHGLVSKFT